MTKSKLLAAGASMLFFVQIVFLFFDFFGGLNMPWFITWAPLWATAVSILIILFVLLFLSRRGPFR